MSTNDVKEYIVTLKNHNDLDSFYDDMETPGGDLYIPNRRVEVAHRREISRNTHYYLTDQEVLQLKNDPRVGAVESAIPPQWMKKKQHNIIEASFDDSNYNVSQKSSNYGIDLCTRGITYPYLPVSTSSIRLPATGRNVDVVIVDGHMIEPGHPEYAKNFDGTGPTRLIQRAWFQGYVYNKEDGSYHGAHVASTAAGNRQGWAASANIYNISPFQTSFPFDYIRAWHNSKPINPVTGIKNPTVTNNSWGWGAQVSYDEVDELWQGGVKVYDRSRDGDFTRIDAEAGGVESFFGTLYIPIRQASLDADVLDAWNDGIFNVAAAGNERTYIGQVNGQYWNDRLITTNNDYIYTHRGSSPGSGTGIITVGSCVASGPGGVYRSGFSNHGPGVQIWAPGTDIMGALSNDYPGQYNIFQDPRNSAYRIGTISGTSMASPQVAGIAACVLELFPHFTPTEVYNYLVKHSWNNIIKEYQVNPSLPGVAYNPIMDDGKITGSPNRVAGYYKYRPDVGMNWPRVNNDDRPTQGMCWPRMTKY